MYVSQHYKNRRITNRLAVHRAIHRWTQDDVARKIGFKSKYRYGQIENDLRLPTFRERAKLARLFGVHESEIFPKLVRKPKPVSKVVAA